MSPQPCQPGQQAGPIPAAVRAGRPGLGSITCPLPGLFQPERVHEDSTILCKREAADRRGFLGIGYLSLIFALVFVRSLQPGQKPLWERNCHFLIMSGRFLFPSVQGIFLQASPPARLEVTDLTCNPCPGRREASHQSCLPKLLLQLMLCFITCCRIG